MSKPLPGYKARKGSRVSNEAVATFGPVLRDLAAREKATPEELVRLASPRRSPLHKFFEWDDEEAAHKYRVQQARDYMRAIVVEFDVEEVGLLQVRVFTPDEVPGNSWTFALESLDTENPLADVIARAQAEQKQFARKYRELRTVAEAIPMMTGIDKFLKDL